MRVYVLILACAVALPAQEAMHFGSISGRVTDPGGALVASADYDAWGTLRAQTGSQPSHGLTGERQDPTTGLVYLRARDYAPRRTTQGLSRPEIIRCLKRYLAREVYTALLNPDLPHPDGDVPGSDVPGSDVPGSDVPDPEPPDSDVLTADPSSAPAAPCTAQKASTRSARSAARTNGVDTAKRRKTINRGGNTPRRQPPNTPQRDA